MLRVILRPALNRHGKRLHGKFVVTLDGRQLCISRQPLLDAARVLINEGIDPATPIATRHAGAGFDAVTSTVGTAAKWTVREDSTVSPTFVRWKAFSRDDVQSPMRFGEGPVPDPVFGAGRIHGADRVGMSSTIKLTRAQRRQMQKLTDKVDRVAEADSLFFEHFPHRQYRVRLTSQAEIARQELIDGRPMTIPPGHRWFTAVHNIAPRYRLCLFVRNLEGAETDLDEVTAREVFEWVAEPYRDIEARLRKAAGVRP